LPGTGCETALHNQVALFWNQGKTKLTVPLGLSNVALFQIAPGHAKFAAFCAKAEVNYKGEQCDLIVVASSQAARASHDKNVAPSPDANNADWSQPIGTHSDLIGPKPRDTPTACHTSPPSNCGAAHCLDLKTASDIAPGVRDGSNATF
jgi:hypothetical protein